MRLRGHISSLKAKLFLVLLPVGLTAGLAAGIWWLQGSSPAHALNSSDACTRYYGAPVANAPFFNGIPGRTSWDHNGYHYEIKGFAFYGNVNSIQDSIIDSREPDSCTGGMNVNNDPALEGDDWVRMDGLKWKGAKPINAYLGVPTTAPSGGNWSSNSGISRGGDTTATPPTFYQQQGYMAGYVDDGGKAVIENANGEHKLLWCAFIDDAPNQLEDYKDDDTCHPDATAAKDAYNLPVSGSLFVSEETTADGLTFTVPSCATNNLCAEEYRKWYRPVEAYEQYGNDIEYRDLIGFNAADGSLKDFQLHMQTRQTDPSGFGSWFVMTFKYPISNAQCIGITTVPAQPPVGSTFTATVTMRNTGNTTWSHTGANAFKLGAAQPQDTTKWSPVNGATTNRVNLTAPVAPNTNVPITFTARRDAADGNTFAWSMVQEGVQWFDAAGTQRCTYTFAGEILLHKIFLANRIDIPLSFVRDNFQFAINLMAYFWPDAGRRSQASDRTNRLWLAGIWGKDGINGGDTSSDQSATNTSLNSISVLNTNSQAESGCDDTPSGCRERVPLAYVPQDDQAGFPSSGTQDGSTTPNGNLWLSIRDRYSNVTSGYDSKEGGIASNLDDVVGGAGGTQMNNVEISNIRVEAVGITHSAADNSGGQAGGYGQGYQGLVDDDILQPDSTTQGLNLPGGSQGPQGNKWDNIRNPQGGASVYSGTIFGSNLDNTNSGGSPANFTDNPESTAVATINTFVGRARQVGSITATSLLQDGQGTYNNKTEPVTFSGTVTGVSNARLKWDEYIDWTQVDDKGHWYTDKENRPTGVYQGPGDTDSYSLQSANTGSAQDIGCAEFGPDPPGPAGPPCIRRAFTTCSSTSYRTGISYSYNNLTYYSPSTQSRHGWYNTQTTTSSMPYGGPGGTAQSAFYSSYSNSPAWSNTGSSAFWQDTNVTSMSNSGSTNKPAHTDRWIRNTSDPAYTNRYLFINQHTPNFPTGWSYTYSSACIYPNGGVSNAGGGTTATFYPSAGYLYENSGAGSGTVHGTYGAGATFDGVSDGQVDVGWSWASNKQRVRYEQTYNGHYRNLGPRNIFSSDDELLIGVGSDDEPGKPARGMTTIGNPTIGASEGDIYAGGGISSYFENSSSSAFIFTNQTISNFSAAGYYAGYYINRDRDRVNAAFPGGDSVRYVFKNFDTDLLGKAVDYPGGSSVNLDGKIYKTSGNYTIGATTFCNGAGTIIVQGNLTITGNLDYCNGTNRADLPSVGFIVTGNVSVDPSVNFIKGAYFANGTFSTGSYLLSASGAPNNNRTVNDAPFVLQGLIVANRFSLDRQPSGSGNNAGTSETFAYDGRIVISSPPGFSSLYNIPAVWNEGAPSN